MTVTIERLAKANYAVEQLISHKAHDLALTSRQMQVLLALHADEGKTAAEIGRELGIEKTTIAHVVRRMVKMKLLKQKPRKDDARAEENYMTAGGKKKASEVHRVVMEVEHSLAPLITGTNRGIITQLTQIAAMWKS